MADPNVIEQMFRADQGLGNDRPLDMEPHIHMLEFGRNANFEMISRKIAPKKPKSRMQYYWRFRDLTPMRVRITSASAAGASSINVDRPDYIHRDVGLYNTTTEELMICNEDAAVAPTTDVEIRSYSHATPGTAALRYATAVDQVVIVLPEFHAEGEDMPNAWRTENREAFDYLMQVDRRSADITDIAMAEAEYDPRGQREMDNKMALTEYMKGMNMMFYLSQSTREVLSADGARRHAMGGLRQKITTNRMSLAEVGAGLTPATFDEILRKTMYNSQAGPKIAMIGQYALAAINAWPVGSVQTSPRNTEWGYNIKTLITGHGELDFSYDPMLTEEYGLADIAVIIDTGTVAQTKLNGIAPLKIVQRLSEFSTIHRIVDGISGIFGFQMTHEELNAWIEGIS